MRRTLLLICLAGCPSNRQEAPDALSAEPDAPPDSALPDRQVNNVIVGQTLTLWSHGQFQCSLEFGCPPGPTVSAFNGQQDQVSTWVDGGVGTPQIAGTETELYFVNGDNNQEMYLKRLGGVGTQALSIPRPNLSGPTVDDTYVYWTDERPAYGYDLHRASRAGDGTDAATIASTTTRADHLTYSAGYIWWVEEAPALSLLRVPVSGGTPARVLDAVTAVVATSDGLYVGRLVSRTGGHIDGEVGHVDAAGAYQPIASHSAADMVPRYLVADGDQLFWSAGDGNLYFAPLAGGSVGTLQVDDKVGYAFAVLPDRYLVEFTRNGFRAVPR